MKPRILVAFALLLSLLAGTAQADAARRGSVRTQELLYVADSAVERGDQALSVCLLVETHAALVPGINLFRSVDGYALAPNRCDTETFFRISAEQIAQGKTAGMIPADLPNTPALSIAQMLAGHWMLIVVGLIVLLAGLGWARGRVGRARRRGLMGDTDTAGKAVLEAMCYAAKADGTIAEEELEEIRAAASAITGSAFDVETVRAMVESVSDNPADSEFERIAGDAPVSSHETMMRGVLYVVAADGQVVPREWDFVTKLATALRVSGDQLREWVAETAQLRAG